MTDIDELIAAAMKQLPPWNEAAKQTEKKRYSELMSQAVA